MARCGPARPSSVDADQQFETAGLGSLFRRVGDRIRPFALETARPDQYRLPRRVVEPVAIQVEPHDAGSRRRRHDLADRQRDGHRGLCYQHASADARCRAAIRAAASAGNRRRAGAGDTCGVDRILQPRRRLVAQWRRADWRCHRPGDLVDWIDGSAARLGRELNLFIGHGHLVIDDQLPNAMTR